jgi:hypothetical protein
VAGLVEICIAALDEKREAAESRYEYKHVQVEQEGLGAKLKLQEIIAAELQKHGPLGWRMVNIKEMDIRAGPSCSQIRGNARAHMHNCSCVVGAFILMERKLRM